MAYDERMRTLIDGYNLMHARGLMTGRFGPDGLRKARHRFLVDLAAALDPVEAKGTTIVFDAADPPADRPDRQAMKGMEILFAVGDESADARIEALIAAHSAPKSLTVVSSDHRVRIAAERRRARVVTSDAFLSDLDDRKARKGRIAPPKPAADGRERGPSKAEAAYWMAEFADLAADPELADSLRASDFVPTDEEIARIAREFRDET
jgi:predicted RNA-binding protein with PIN domain